MIRMQKSLRLLLSILLAFLLICTIPIFAAADEASESPSKNELIMVLDLSGSMEANDPDRLAVDCLKQLAESLPTEYWNVGVITYNGLVVDSAAATALSTTNISSVLNNVQYGG